MGTPAAHVLDHLRSLIALVRGPRVERDVTGGDVGEHFVAWEPPEDEDVLAPLAPAANALARASHEPELSAGDPGSDPIPEIEEVIDVHLRVLSAAVSAREQPCRHVADHEVPVSVEPAADLWRPLGAHRGEADAVRDHVARFLHPQPPVLVGYPLIDGYAGGHVGGLSSSSSRSVNVGSSQSATILPGKYGICSRSAATSER